MKKIVRGVVIFAIIIAFAFLLYSIYEIYLKGQIEDTGEVADSDNQEPLPVTPYQIPYRVMMPKISEADNLIVTVCVSASHIAYSSLRMEPQYMIMGEAAGIAASMAIDKDTAVQHVDTEILKKILIENGAILEVPVD